MIALHFRAREMIAAELASHGKRPGLATKLAAARVAFLEIELHSVVTAMEHANTPVDCARGCASCCTLTVDITPDEAIATAIHLSQTLAPDELAAARERASIKAERSQGLTPDERHALRLSCAVLDEASGACRAHPIRPAPCQGYLSLDRRRCEADHLGPPVPILQPVAADYIRDAVMAAQRIVLTDAGLSQDQIELTEGILRVWKDPTAETRWLAGDRVL